MIIIYIISLISCSNKQDINYTFDEILEIENLVKIPDSLGISGVFLDVVVDDSTIYYIDLMANRQIFTSNIFSGKTNRFGKLGNGPNEYNGATGIELFNDTIIINDDLLRYVLFNSNGDIFREQKEDKNVGQSQFIRVDDEYFSIKTAPVSHYLYSNKRGHLFKRQTCFQFPSAVSGKDILEIDRKLYFINAAELKVYLFDFDNNMQSSINIKNIAGQQNWEALYDKPVSRKISSKMLKEGYWNQSLSKLINNDDVFLALATVYKTEKYFIIIFDMDGNIKAKFPSIANNDATDYNKYIIHIQDQSVFTFETDSIGDHYFGTYKLKIDL